MNKILRDRSGATLVLAIFVVMTMIMLAGLAIDSGRLYVAKRHAQRVCDAAASAGAEALLKTYGEGLNLEEARQAASDGSLAIIDLENQMTPAWSVSPMEGVTQYAYYGDEGLSAPDLHSDEAFPQVVFYDRFNGNSVVLPKENPVSAIEVKGRARVDFSLSRVMGFQSAWVPVRAIAAIGAIQTFDSAKYLFLPWGIKEKAFGAQWHYQFDPEDPNNPQPAQPNKITTFYVSYGDRLNSLIPLWTTGNDADYKQRLATGYNNGVTAVGDILSPGALSDPQTSTWEALRARVSGISIIGITQNPHISPSHYHPATSGTNEQYDCPGDDSYGADGSDLMLCLSPTLSDGVTPNSSWYGRNAGPALQHYDEWRYQDNKRADGRVGWVPVLAQDQMGNVTGEIKGFAVIYIANFYFRKFENDMPVYEYALTPDAIPPDSGDWRLAIDVIFVPSVLVQDAPMLPGASGYGVYSIALVR